jgi:ATP-dependent DNA helicase RecG
MLRQSNLWYIEGMQHATDDELGAIIQAALRANSETDRIEFKDARGGLPEDLWKSITAFSNKQNEGGLIGFGVTEDARTRKFEIVQIPNLHDLQERATNYFNDRIVNGDRPQYKILDIDSKQILVMVVNTVPDEKKPCFDRRFGMDRGACIRDGNTDRPITDDELRHFIRNSAAFKFDISPVDNFAVNELDTDKIQRVLREMGMRTGRQNADDTVNDAILQNTQIAVTDHDQLKPTLAGALIFSRDDPSGRSPFNRYVIRCIRYSGSTPASEIIDSQDIAGTLDKQIDNAQAFVLRNISRSAVIEGTKRVERFEYPEEAIREVLANAVIHRDYTITESYTQVRVFSDRIEVMNPGNLPPGVTVDNIKEMQFSRNSVMASLMRDLNYLEEYGRGIDLVFSSMQQIGLPRPVFRNTANMFTVTLLGSRFGGLTERQLAVWQIVLNRSRVSAKVISEQVGVSRPPVVNDLNKLIELGLVVALGSGPTTTYEIGSNL